MTLGNQKQPLEMAIEQQMMRMTDSEMDEAMAREVMNWEDTGSFTSDGRPVVGTPHGGVSVCLRDWNPTKDLKAAFTVLYEMRRIGIGFVLSDSVASGTSVVRLGDWVEMCGKFQHWDGRDGLPRTICEATLKVVRLAEAIRPPTKHRLGCYCAQCEGRRRPAVTEPASGA
jgi:hypothetical protein